MLIKVIQITLVVFTPFTNIYHVEKAKYICLNKSKLCFKVLQIFINHSDVTGIDTLDNLKDRDSKCFIHHKTSTTIFPIGYCKQNGVKVQGATDFMDKQGLFEWNRYRYYRKAGAAPSKLFQCNLFANKVNRFKVGMKVEVVDLLNPKFIYEATVVKRFVFKFHEKQYFYMSKTGNQFNMLINFKMLYVLIS